MNGFTIGAAHAADQSETHTIIQRQSVSADNWSIEKRFVVYVGDVHIKRPNDILVFIHRAEYDDFVNQNVAVSYNNIRKYVDANDIIFEDKLKHKQRGRFEFDGQEYYLLVKEIRWSVVGDDAIDLEIGST